MLQLIDAVVTSDTAMVHGSLTMRQQECFAIKPDVSADLDVIRELYIKNVEDIGELVDRYRSECALAASCSRARHC